jgi:hypothetical protein
VRPSLPRRAVDWLLRDRRTGRIVVAQTPNAPLLVFAAATVVRLALDPTGAVRTAVTVVGGVALAWWAGDEIVRGVNPFRRALGALVLVSWIVGLVHD